MTVAEVYEMFGKMIADDHRKGDLTAVVDDGVNVSDFDGTSTISFENELATFDITNQ